MALTWPAPQQKAALAKISRKADSSTGIEAELARCRADVFYFIDNYLIIDDAQGDGVGTMRFRLWDAQRESLMELRDNRLVIFLKARQLGISWLVLAYGLWLMLFHPGKVVLLFSQGENESAEMLRRLKAMYDRLPDWFLDALPARNRNNTSEQGWTNGSWCKCLPATQKAGRSFTASLVIMDEAAHQQWGGKLYAALKPTIDKGGKLFVVSSANGSDGFFNKLWKKAEAGTGTFKPIFLPWWSEPSRDQSWYDRQVADSTDPDLVKQEYPSTSLEAFIASGRSRFHPSWVAAQLAHVRDPIEPRTLPDLLRGVDGARIYKLPEKDRRVILAADVAEGLGTGDYSAAVAFDKDTGEELACLHGRWEPDEFAAKLSVLADAYDARIVVERNNHGHAVISKLKTLCSWRVADGHDERPGWLTGVLTKPVAIDALAVGLRDGAVQVRTRSTVDEIGSYSVLDNGKTSAPPGEHDDLVMAWAVGLGWNQMVGWKDPVPAFLGGQDRHAQPRPGPARPPGPPGAPPRVPGRPNQPLPRFPNSRR